MRHACRLGSRWNVCTVKCNLGSCRWSTFVDNYSLIPEDLNYLLCCPFKQVAIPSDTHSLIKWCIVLGNGHPCMIEVWKLGWSRGLGLPLRFRVPVPPYKINGCFPIVWSSYAFTSLTILAMVSSSLWLLPRTCCTSVLFWGSMKVVQTSERLLIVPW